MSFKLFLSFISRALSSLFLVLLLANGFYLRAQQSQVYKPNVNRVLFLLDVSGSMKEEWKGKKKYDVAKDLLYKLIDSVEKKNANVEFAIRAFGYQFPRSERNCKDSRLIVPFAKNNADKIQNELSRISPQGMTPIAYSLQQSVNDFPIDQKSLNSIIIITDGNENCGGDLCASTRNLIDKKISVRPFIVGLNVGEKNAENFKCIGTFMDTQTDTAFYNTVGVIIRQTLNTTTAQVNLLDANANPTVTNIPFTLYDHETQKILYNFVHTLNERGDPDTLYLDPVGLYDLEVHTIPSIRKNMIELVAGKHNIIALDVPVGRMGVECFQANYKNNDAQCVVRSSGHEILNVQDLNTEENYLAGKYPYEVLTTPRMNSDTTVYAFYSAKLMLQQYGTLSIISDKKFLGSVYSGKVMVDRFEITPKTISRKLQPGTYRIVYKPLDNYDSESTRSEQVQVFEAQNTVLNLIGK